MNKKLLTILAILLISLASMAMGAASITTADGDGADGGVANDTNRQDTYDFGSEGYMEIRHIDDSRAKAVLLRFDVGSGVGGDLSGATLSIIETTGNRSRTVNIYGLADETDEFSWDDSSCTYNNVPGLIDPETDGYITMEEGIWEVVGTMAFESIDSATVITGEIDPNFISSDTNGAITLMLYTPGSDASPDYYVALKEQTDGHAYPTLSFPNARFATSPTPENNGLVTTEIAELSWSNVEPNDISGEITCDVYFGTEPNRIGNMNMITTTAGVNSVAINTTNFPDYGTIAAGTYYWTVDTYDSSSTPAYLGKGAMWSFEVTSVPVITIDAEDQIVFDGDPAEFSVAISSDSEVTYTWYLSENDVIDETDTQIASGTTNDVLSFTSVSGTDEGYYYCKAVNDSGEENAVYSTVVRLGVKRQIAHYPLDALVSDQYEDISGEGHNADPNYPSGVTFDTGVATGTNNGAVIDVYGAATAGTWNPSYVTGEFTISLWAKRTGTCDHWDDMVSKHNDWDTEETMWQLGINSSNTLGFICANGSDLYGEALAADMWTYVALTYDGSTATIYSFEVGSDAISFSENSNAFTLGNTTDANLNIGCYYDSGVPLEIFPGVLDEIQIFNYAKSATEIADMFNEAVSQDFCLRDYPSELDFDNDCVVDLGDFAAVASDWLTCGLYPNCP